MTEPVFSIILPACGVPTIVGAKLLAPGLETGSYLRTPEPERSLHLARRRLVCAKFLGSSSNRIASLAVGRRLRWGCRRAPAGHRWWRAQRFGPRRAGPRPGQRYDTHCRRPTTGRLSRLSRGRLPRRADGSATARVRPVHAVDMPPAPGLLPDPAARHRSLPPG